MSRKTEGALLTRYLLGELPEGERERLEETYFGDDATFEQVLIAEEELIDAYVRGDLPPPERERFERLFLASPRGRERVLFARTLAAAVSEPRPAETPRESVPRPRPSFLAALRPRATALGFAAAFGVLVVAAGLAWLIIERVKMRDELRQLRDERAGLRESVQELDRRVAAENSRSEELLRQLEDERGRPAPEKGPGGETVAGESPRQSEQRPRPRGGTNGGVIARRYPERSRGSTSEGRNTTDATPGSGPLRIDRLPREERTTEALLASVAFDLKPGTVRGGGAQTLEVPEKATFVLLQVRVETDSGHKNYRAGIETADGREVWRAESFKPPRRARARGAVELPAVRARLLPPGDYVLVLSGQRRDGDFESVADYSFRILRK
ncbi:MAG TPA: hypothetical protein VJT74_01730 [Pyrinomonadaceae bacterium]|nr:hypothetical protein [Pyrinomonadaceae bacterium]